MTEEDVSAGGPVPPGEEARVHLFVSLARAYGEEGLLEDAVRVLREGLARDADVPQGRRLLAEMLQRLGQGPVELELPLVTEQAEPSVLFLDPPEPGAGPPVASPFLAALYEAQGEGGRAAEVRRALERRSVCARLQGSLGGLRDARAAWLAGPDGRLQALVHRPAHPAADVPGSGWGLVMDEVRGLAEVLEMGTPRTLSLVWSTGRTAFGFLESGMALGLEGGPEALPGQMRCRLREAIREAWPGGEGGRSSRSGSGDSRG